MNLVICIAVLIVLQGIVEFWLLSLNERKMLLGMTSQPAGIADFFSKDNWRECSVYNIAKTKFSKITGFISSVLSLLTLLLFMPWFMSNYSMSKDIGIWEISVKVSVFLIVLQMPSLISDWYYQFKLEDRFGFNKQSLSLWISDKFKEYTISFILISLMLALIIFLFRSLFELSPDFWWVWTGFAIFVAQLMLMVVWPALILPLFNTLTPLDDERLKERIEKLAERTGFRAKKIEVMDGSKRSGHSNAFFTGFGKFRRIILFDTLLHQMNEEEIEAVVAHEIGHYRMGHIPKRLFLSLITGFLLLLLIHLAIKNDWLLNQFNLSLSMSGAIAPVLLTVFLFGSIFTYWLKPMMNTLSRKHEYEADNFASLVIEEPMSLRTALKKLCVENLSYPLPHKLLSWFHHSHPSIPERDFKLSKSVS